MQKCSDALVEIAVSNYGVITAEAFELAAQSTDNILHQVFNWDITKEERLAQASYILSNIPILISSNNTLYTLKEA